MTEAHARQAANVILAAVAVGAAVAILRHPPLRRTVWRMAKAWASGPAAAWALGEVRTAWAASGRRPA